MLLLDYCMELTSQAIVHSLKIYLDDYHYHYHYSSEATVKN